MSLILALLIWVNPIKIGDLTLTIEQLDGWERIETPQDRLHLKNGDADIQLLVVKRAPRTLEALEKWWRASMELAVPHPDARVVKRAKFGGEPCLIVDISAGDMRVTWLVVRRGDLAYGLHIQRPNNSDLEQDIARIRNSFRFLRKSTPKTGPKGQSAKPVPREGLAFDYWRFDCIKPAGMRARPPSEFDASEKAASVVARFDVVKEQSRLMIRVFAHRKSMPIKMLGEQRIKEFVQRYPRHKEPVVDRKWKLRMARRALHLRLVGLKATKVTEDWYFAACRNGCTYQFQIYRTGAVKWDAQIKDFLDNFRPRRKTRLAGPP